MFLILINAEMKRHAGREEENNNGYIKRQPRRRYPHTHTHSRTHSSIRNIPLQKAMSQKLLLSSCLAAVLVVVVLQSCDAKPAGGMEKGEGGNMESALNYLEQLDKYYSQVARPR